MADLSDSKRATLSFTKIISLVEELASSEDKSVKAFRDKVVRELQDRMRKEDVENDFSEFQEPFLYVPQEDAVQPYVFYQDFIVPPKRSKKKHKDASKKKKEKKQKSSKSDKRSKKSDKSSKKSDKSSKKSKKPRKDKENVEKKIPEPVETEEMILSKIIKHKLKVIEKTILTLLGVGADCNIGDVPLPIILLGTFAKNLEIFKVLLATCQNPIATTPKDNLTPLHILASFPPTSETVAMCMELLNKTNPNLRAHPNHWSSQKDKILAKAKIEEDLGKTPLHLLCLREDFNECDVNLENLCVALLKAGSDPNSYYLGHTALSLAVVKGNARLLETLLKSGLANPNQILELGMGTPLTTLLLKRYKNLLPLEDSQRVYEILVQYQGNPLNSTGERGNAFEFDVAEYALPEKRKKGNKKDGKKGKGSVKDKKSSKGSKGSKGSKKSKGSKGSKGSKKGKHKLTTQDVLRDYLIETGREKILQHSEGTVAKLLYDLISLNLHRGQSQPKHLAKMLTLQKAHNVLKFLIKENVISNPKLKTCYKFLKYINDHGTVFKATVSQDDLFDFDDMVDDLDLTPNPSTQKYLVHPWIDPDEDKYKVCFECLTRMEKHLISCPKCEQIYFCSQECNKANNARKPKQHVCGNLFYNAEKRAQDERESKGKPRIKSTLAKMMEQYERLKEEKEIRKMHRQKEIEKNAKLGIVPKGKHMHSALGGRGPKHFVSFSGDATLAKKGAKMGVTKSKYKGYSSSSSGGGSGVRRKDKRSYKEQGYTSSTSSEGRLKERRKKSKRKDVLGRGDEKIDDGGGVKKKPKENSDFDGSPSGDTKFGKGNREKGAYFGGSDKEVDGTKTKSKFTITSKGKNVKDKHYESSDDVDRSKDEFKKRKIVDKVKNLKEKNRRVKGSSDFDSSPSGDTKFGKGNREKGVNFGGSDEEVDGTKTKGDSTTKSKGKDSKDKHYKSGLDIDANFASKDKFRRVKTRDKDGNVREMKARKGYDNESDKTYLEGVQKRKDKSSKGKDNEEKRLSSKNLKNENGLTDKERRKLRKDKHKWTESSSESQSQSSGFTLKKRKSKHREFSSEGESVVSKVKLKNKLDGTGKNKRNETHVGDDYREEVKRYKKRADLSDSDDEYEKVKGKRIEKEKAVRKTQKTERVDAKERRRGALQKTTNAAATGAKEKQSRGAGGRQSTKSGRASSSSGFSSAFSEEGIANKRNKAAARKKLDSKSTNAHSKAIRGADKVQAKESKKTLKMKQVEPLKETASPQTRLNVTSFSEPPKTLTGFYSPLKANAKRLPLRFQYFMRDFASYFDNFDWFKLMMPYAVFYRDQLYYKFSDDCHVFVGTYSDV